jgi:1-acyl-sn-glycerol-3-phosphate acyltransferase
MSTAIEITKRHDRLGGEVELPLRWLWLVRLFRWYAPRYIRKHFHAVRLSKSGRSFPPNPGSAAILAARKERPGWPRSQEAEPLLIVLNHPSWWDPMICTMLSRIIAQRDQFGAIDGQAVKQYGFFKKMGFIGVDTKSLSGAAEFVRTGRTILSHPNRVFWVTAQGRFTDVRERPLAISSGVGHLAARLTRGIVLPLALEYPFWNERSPEALVRVGEPLRIADHPELSSKDWTALIEDEMTRNLDALNAEAMSRDPAKFTELLTGKTGVGGPYDWWRRLKAWVRGRKFDPSHGQSATQEKRP